MTKWLQLLSASFIRGLWLRIHMHHPTETTPRAAGLSAVGAWGGQAVWMAGTHLAQPATDEWVLQAFPHPGVQRWPPDRDTSGGLPEPVTDDEAGDDASQRHQSLAASLEDTYSRLEERANASPHHRTTILNMKEKVRRVQASLDTLPTARTAVRPATPGAQSPRTANTPRRQPQAAKEGEMTPIEFSLPFGSIIRAYHSFFDKAKADTLFQALDLGIKWSVKNMADAGAPQRLENRMTCFFADKPHLSYRYAGKTNSPHAWTPELQEIKQTIEEFMVRHPSFASPSSEGGGPWTFNSCLANRYSTPHHSLGFHSDNEPDLVRDAPIASVSFGAPRRMEFKPKRISHMRGSHDQMGIKSLVLTHGSLLIMGGTTQRHWLHSIPRLLPTDEAQGVRINLTFRVLLDGADAGRSNSEGTAPRSTISGSHQGEAGALLVSGPSGTSSGR